jgi:hypothetical protein
VRHFLFHRAIGAEIQSGEQIAAFQNLAELDRALVMHSGAMYMWELVAAYSKMGRRVGLIQMINDMTRRVFLEGTHNS